MKTAIFLDWENLHVKVANIPKSIPALISKIQRSPLVGDIVLIRAYISKSQPIYTAVKTELDKLDIELIGVEPLSNSANKKANMVDLKMGVDIVATVASKRSVETVVIGSGDADFGFLCEQIKRMKRNLIVVSDYLTTGDGLFKICDDYISIMDMAITTQIICKMINIRQPQKYANIDFVTALSEFLSGIENDNLLRRYMTEYGLPSSSFVGLLNARNISFLNYQGLGFATMTAFIEVLFSESNFNCKSGIITYLEDKNPISQVNLIKNYLRLPGGYSKEKLMKYYDILALADNFDEFLVYFTLMRRGGMVNDNKLCPKRTFKATIRKHMSEFMKKFGVILTDKTLEELNAMIDC